MTAKNSFKWSAIERIFSQLLQLLIMLILAKLLGPKDFGLVALLMVFINIAQVFVDSGFLIALIRKEDCSEKDYATAFYCNVLLGFFSIILMFGLSEPISEFYNSEALKGLLIFLSISLLFNSLSIVQRARLSRKLDFKSQAKASIISISISGAVSIGIALNGGGVWALVVQYVLASCLNTVLLYAHSPWFPVEKFCKTSFDDMFVFSYKLLISGLIDSIYKNMYSLVIGKVFNPTQVGLFNQARQLSGVPAITFTTVIQRVTFPLLSQMQDNPERMDATYLEVLKVATAVIFPLMFGIAVGADSIIYLVLGTSWQDSVQYLIILCVAFSFYPIHAINLNLLHVKGRSDLFLKLEIIKKTIGGTILVISLKYGVSGICYGLLLMSILELFINTAYTGKLTTIKNKRQFSEISVIFLISFSAAFFSWWLFNGLTPSLMKLVLSLSVASIIYLSALFIF